MVNLFANIRIKNIKVITWILTGLGVLILLSILGLGVIVKGVIGIVFLLIILIGVAMVKEKTDRIYWLRTPCTVIYWFVTILFGLALVITLFIVALEIVYQIVI